LRIESLTGVRIVAAVAVFLSHVSNPVFVPGAAFVFMQSGYNGVTLFFTLSGFVLAWTYLDRMSTLTVGNLRSYFVARLARIYPLYLFALALAAIPYLLGPGVEGDVWSHIFAVQAWSPDYSVAFGYNGPGWSIGVEFFLYACFPLLIIVLGRAKRSVLIAVAIGTVVGVFVLALIFLLSGAAGLSPVDPASAHRWLYRTPVTRLGDFTVGIVAALLIRRAGRAPVWAAYAAQAIGVVLFGALMFNGQVVNSVWSWDAVYLVPTFLVIWGLAAGQRSFLAVFLGSKPMVVLGEASFAFYLLHGPVLGIINFPIPTSFNRWALVVFAEFVLIMLVSIGAHKMIELPAQRWIRGHLDRGRAKKASDDRVLVGQ
jgi:peptidoglycan/LPS O-acetylase OafA/YrhL